jgi:flagellar motor switch/type III secretory pathway protein FliN
MKRRPSTSDAKILQVPVELEAVLGTATLTVGELAQLRRGSTVLLDQKVTDPVTVYAGPLEVCTGSVYAVRGQFAVRVDRSVLWPSDSG